jgi:plastocyanin
MVALRSICSVVLLVAWVWPWASSAVADSVSGHVVLSSAEGRAAKRRDHSGTVVWLEPLGTTVRPASSTAKPAMMMQRNKTFMPHVMAIEVGTRVDFPNNDAIVHNVFSNFDGQVFDVQLYAPQTAKRVVFRRPGMVRVFCNMHETMSAVIAVLPAPYFAVTDASGAFALQAPPGEYRLQFWHERARPEVLSRLAQPVMVGATALSLPDTPIATTDQPLPPHKNKYGHDYVQRADEHIFYPGARR